MDGGRVNAVAVELVCEPISADAGRSEDQYLPQIARLHEIRKQLALALAPDRVCHVLHQLGRGVEPGHLHEHRVVQEGVGERANVCGQGGRKQQVLSLLGQERHDATHVRDESHVEHAVGFVEHKSLDLLQVHRLLLHVVEQAAGSRHQELDTLAQGRGLRLHIDPPEHHGAAQTDVLTIGPDALLHLRCQLPRGGENERAHRMARRRSAGIGVPREPLQERQSESGGLAGAGLGAPQDIAPLQHQRNRLRLDRRRLDVSLLSDRFQQLGQQVQFSKTRQTNTLLPPSVRAEETSVGDGRSADRAGDKPRHYSKGPCAVRRRLSDGEFLGSARSMTLQPPGDVLAHECRRVLRSRAQCREHAPAARGIAEPHGEIAQPAFVADPQDGAAGHALPEFVSVPREKVDELGAVQAVTHLEIKLRRELRVAVPRADELAVVAAEYAVADERPQFDGNAPFQLDREIGNAAPRVQRIRCDDGARRADIQTLGAAAAVLAHRYIQGKRQIRVDVSEKEIRARLAREQQGVFAPPAESRLACQLHFHHRRRIGKHAVTELADFACHPFGELPQPAPQHLVIVAPKRIAGHERLGPVGENAPAFGRAGTIVHACRNNAQRAGNEGRGSRPFAAVLSHIIEFAGEARCEPCGEARLGRREVGVGDSDSLETQLAPPGFNRRGEHREVGGPRPPRPDCFRMTHSQDHSQPPAKAHWTTYLPDEGATAGLGAKLAACIGPGVRIYLRGELGSGKTTLIRSLLRALGVKDTVKSPSYALVELYVVSRLDLYHFDFYRFLDAREFEDAGLADYFRGEGVCLVEWPERAGDALPPPDLELTLAYSDTGREISVKAHSAAGERCLAKSQDA